MVTADLLIDVLDLPLGWAFRSIGGPTLRVANRTWPEGTISDDAVAGQVAPSAVTATEDGRPAQLGHWHAGPEAESVYAERYETRGAVTGRTFHGFIDSVSRRVVQAG